MSFIILLTTIVSISMADQNGVPDAEDTLISFGSAQQLQVPVEQPLEMLVWNIYKANRPGLLTDLIGLSRQSQFAVLQEVVVNPTVTYGLLSVPGFEWHKAISFYQRNGQPTGVGTGSLFNPQAVESIRSKAREPILNTPKMMVLTSYQIEGRKERLMVANIHAINFVTNSKYKSQLQQLEAAVREHQGPMIWAGDFNTHHRDRYLIMARVADSLGLDIQKLRNDHRLLALDHVLTRGVDVLDAEVINEIKSSDHQPVRLRFKVR